jgi:hypothetical protein
VTIVFVLQVLVMTMHHLAGVVRHEEVMQESFSALILFALIDADGCSNVSAISTRCLIRTIVEYVKDDCYLPSTPSTFRDKILIHGL